MADSEKDALICHVAKCGLSRSNGTSVIREICLKNLSPHMPPFKATQGVIGTDTD